MINRFLPVFAAAVAMQASVAASPQDEIVVTTGPIVAASPWSQSVRGVCRGNVLEISNYGARRPLTGSADIRLNHRAVVGPGVEQLRDDLSLPDAVYRFQIICRQEGILLIVDRGVPSGDDVAYARGVVRWVGRRFETYEGMSRTEASTFWF